MDTPARRLASSPPHPANPARRITDSPGAAPARTCQVCCSRKAPTSVCSTQRQHRCTSSSRQPAGTTTAAFSTRSGLRTPQRSHCKHSQQSAANGSSRSPQTAQRFDTFTRKRSSTPRSVRARTDDDRFTPITGALPTPAKQARSVGCVRRKASRNATRRKPTTAAVTGGCGPWRKPRRGARTDGGENSATSRTRVAEQRARCARSAVASSAHRRAAWP